MNRCWLNDYAYYSRTQAGYQHHSHETLHSHTVLRIAATDLETVLAELLTRCPDRVLSLLLDRIRLLSAGSDGADWLPAMLNETLRKWVSPRIARLERAA